MTWQVRSNTSAKRSSTASARSSTITAHDGRAADAELTCSCGAEGLTDHPLHVAEQIVDGLGLKPHSIDEAKKQIRYATASLDWELTKLEGAEY